MNERIVYLVRHCKPNLPSDSSICIGITDIPLSEEGFEQAEKLKRYFSDKNIKAIYSSPLIRAKETAEIIANNKIKVEIRNDFSELNMGKWDGMTFEEIKQKYPDEYIERGNDFENYIVEGGESMSMCRDRALAQLWNIINNSTDNIIIVAHAGVNRLILSELLAVSIKESFSFRQEYGSVNILKHDGNILEVINIGVCVNK
ncbi:MAG: histidine phosphatase family protein [Clostridiaceae bacterium]|nr:histidine phosphatase family protein [Clostridiaceae bacterium]